MPLISILVVTGIASAFVVFGLALAYAEAQTRPIVRAREAARRAKEMAHAASATEPPALRRAA